MPPFNLGLLVFVALVPWLRSLRSLTPGEARRSGAWLGFVFFASQGFWLVPFMGGWTGSQLLATIPWMIVVFAQIPYFVLLAWLCETAYRADRPWLVPLAWAGVEAFRSFIPTLAFPHSHLAMPLWPFPALIQGAGWGTVFLVSAWVVLLNVIGVEIWETRNARRTATMVLVSVGMALMSFVRYREPVDGKTAKVAVGQLGEDMAFSNRESLPYRVASAVDELFGLAAQSQADFLVLPEGVTSGGMTVPPQALFNLPPPLPAVFGGQRAEGPFIYQSSFAYDGQGYDVADKVRLVIFGEFVPFRQQLEGLLGSFKIGAIDLTPGARTKALKVGSYVAGPVVCFETMFSDVAWAQQMNGAQFLAVQSIDDWYVGSGMPEQLFAASAFRSVESGLPVARAASLGWSGVFDARGNLVMRAPFGVRVLRTAEVVLPERGDGFAWRWVFPWAAGLIALGHALWVSFLRKVDK